MKLYLADVSALEEPACFAAAYHASSPLRREKADRLRSAEDRRLCLGAGLVWQQAMDALGLDAQQRMVAYGAQGKPYLPNCAQVHFNLSHSGTRVMCAVSETPVGCDVQRIGAQTLAVAKRFFAPEEYAYLLAQPETARPAIFARLWTLKESYLKATGEGLGALTAAALALTPRVHIRGAEAWRFFELDVDDGYRYAACEASEGEPALPEISWISEIFRR